MNNEFKRMQKLAGLITEGYGAREYEEGKEAGEKIEKKKMKKSELKEKIKEMILAEIDGEDYGDIGPGGDIEAGEYGYEEMEKLKQLTAGDDYDSMDDSDLVKAAYDQGMEEVVVMNAEGDLVNREEVLDALKGSLEEAKKKKEEEPAEEVPAEEEIDMTADMEAPEGEADMGMDMGAMDTAAPAVSGDAQSVQKELMDALEAAKAMGDEKLVRQIGNALTYFTRQQVSGEESNAI